MFWFKLKSGMMVFPVMDPASGMPTVQEAMFYVVAEQNYVNNPVAQGGITGGKIPQSN